MKIFILFALVAAASAISYNYGANRVYSLGGYGSLGYSGLTGLGYGYGTTLGGYSGLTGLGYGYGKTIAYAAPAAAYTYAAPAVAHVAAAPAVAHVAAAPAVAHVGHVAHVAHHGPVSGAVHSQRSVQVLDVGSTGGVAAPQSVVIPPSVQPVDIEFQSQSSPVNTRQTHIPGVPNAPQFSSHQEEADYLKQEIVKPVVHEVHEAIQPFRKITQEVRPVQESVHQLLAQGHQQVQAVAAPVATTAVAAPVAVQTVAAAPVAVAAAPATYGLVGTTGYTTGLSGLTGLTGYTTGLAGYGYGLGAGYGYGRSLIAAKPTLALAGHTGFTSGYSTLPASFAYKRHY